MPALREASVPQSLASGVVREPLVDASHEEMLLRVPGVGRFLLARDGPVLVQRVPGAGDADLRCFRDEAVAAGAALLRGNLALRAAAVAVDGAAIVVCGPSAAGKSALAAALAQRGHGVLADAVSIVSARPDGLEVDPTAPEPALWPDVVRQLGLSPEGGRLVRAALTKRAYHIGPPARPARPAVVAFLSVDPGLAEPAVAPLVGAAALEALAAASWHLRVVFALGLTGAHFGVITELAASARCVRLRRPATGIGPASLAELVEGLVA